ncbi:MAG: alpha/beta hydrolase, partial [Primorskyibacter sp.]
RLGLMYGHGTRNALDIFLPLARPAGLVVFVHGGYWLRFDRSDWSHFAQGAVDRGWAVAMPSYDLCPRVRIADITRQVADAITVAAHEVSGPVRVTGHSAGGHLSARMTQPGVLPDDVAGRVDRVVPISPVSDLRPLCKTLMNQKFNMTEADAAAESPALMPAPDKDVRVWVGAQERPVFVDQARWLSQAWTAPLTIAPGLHHFDVIDGLARSDSALMADILGA